MKTTKRMIGILLALCLTLGVMAVAVPAASAAESAEAATGSGAMAIVTIYGLDGESLTRTFNVGESFTVYMTMNTSNYGSIGALSAKQTYTSSVLKLADKYDPDDGEILDINGMFPITGTKTVANCKNAGRITFNATNTKGFPFNDDNDVLIKTNYTVTVPGEAEIRTTMDVLANYELNYIIYNGQVVAGKENFRIHASYALPHEDHTSGRYTYVINSDNTVTITDFYDTDFSGALTIPSSLGGKKVTKIGDSAFSNCTKLQSVVMPDTILSIGKDAFYNCYNLTSITLSSSLKTIGDYAFKYCALKSIVFPNTVATIGEGAFESCHVAESITIPNSVKSIGARAFYGCSSLRSVTIPNSVTTINDSTFGWCSSLKTCTIPSSVITIGESAFENCVSLSSITIPQSVTTIKNEAFADCDSFKSITIPKTVKSIGKKAFSGCNKLEKATISASTIGETMFEDCTSLTSVSISNTVTTINSFAFENCAALKTCTIPTSVKTIGLGAFYHCKAMTSITIPKSVTKIGTDAFMNCINLTIKCYNGSTAHTYAKNNKIKYAIIDQGVITKITNTKAGVQLDYTANKAPVYRVYRSTSKDGKYTAIATGTKTTFVDKTAKSGKTYYYKVRGLSKDKKKFVTIASAAKGIKFLSAPTMSSITNGKTGITVKWKKVTGAARYCVFRRTGSKGTWKAIAYTTKLSLLDKTAKKGVTYQYTVRCVAKSSKTLTSAAKSVAQIKRK